MTAHAQILAWGERGFRYARWRGWPIADAEDIRQIMMLEWLEKQDKMLSFFLAYWRAAQQLYPPWWHTRRGEFPRSLSRLPTTEQQLDASMMLARLSKGDAHLLRRWLTEEEPRNLRPQDHDAKYRAWAYSRILTALRDAHRYEEESWRPDVFS